MFRPTSTQLSLAEPVFGMSDAKQARLARSWAGPFRERCLPLIEETAFAPYFCADNGRPNVSIRLLVGVTILQQVFDLTDAETLGALDFDERWQWAFGLTGAEPVPCQETLHNFRTRLVAHALARQIFETLTDRLLAALGVDTRRQRLDSTQICSNIALLSRLSRFCATFRLLLHRLARHAPDALAQVPVVVQRRYVHADGADSSYDHAKGSEGRRRLAVCARDAWRLLEALRGVALPAPVAEVYTLVARLLQEQCLVLDAPATPAPDDADAAEPPVPVRLREKGEVAAGGLQSPHDPDATYGHKGVGYTVTLCETVGNGDTPELITHVAVTPAMEADQRQTLPTVDALADRAHRPAELLADASFAATEHLLACQADGTTLVGPVTGGAPTTDHPQLYVACLPDSPPSACSLGVAATSTERVTVGDRVRYVVTFAAAGCAGCPQAAPCPSRVRADGTRTWRVTEGAAVNTLRRWQETQPAFHDRYRWRSGIEATNSELKRQHGLGRLRVRGQARVTLAVHFKALACNVKRALRYWNRPAGRSTSAQALTSAWCAVAHGLRALCRRVCVRGDVRYGTSRLHGVQAA